MCFENLITNWYNSNARSLPWRETRDAYRIWLSEVILQQTRVDQGINYYRAILDCYPTVDVLAQAREDEVLKLWQGLGYYSRARNMMKTAKIIHEHYNDVFPDSPDELLKLPGIGPYTACAIASISHDYPCQVIDGNVLRVISRFYGVRQDISLPATHNKIRNILLSQNKDEKSSVFNQSLMEFGALNCTYRNPQCDSCVLNESCFAHLHDLVDDLPLKKKKVVVRKKIIDYLVFFNPMDSTILFKKRPKKGIWAGLYDFPEWEHDTTTKLSVKAMEEFLLQNGVEDYSLKYNVFSIKHQLTHRSLVIQFSLIVTKDIVASFVNKSDFYKIDHYSKTPVPKPVEKFLLYLEKEGVLSRNWFK